MKEKWQEKGQMASAELAIIFPCIMLLVFGVIGFSMFFYDCLKAENAAKNIASRVAVVTNVNEARALEEDMRNLNFPEMKGLLVMDWEVEDSHVVYPGVYPADNNFENNPQYGAEISVKAARMRGLLNYVMGSSDDPIQDKNFRFRCYIHNAHYDYTHAGE